MNTDDPVGRHLVKRKSILNVMLSLGTCFPVGQRGLEDNLACLEWSLAGRGPSGFPLHSSPSHLHSSSQDTGVEFCAGVVESAREKGECAGGGPQIGKWHLESLPPPLVGKTSRVTGSPYVSMLEGREDARWDHSPTVGNAGT